MSLAYALEDSHRTPREAVDCRSRIWAEALPARDALIVNISPHGCMIRSDRGASIGTRLTVDVPGIGAQRGTVIWSLGARLGIEFETAIELAPFIAMLSLLRGPASVA